MQSFIVIKVRKTLIMRTFVCYNILGGFSLLQSEILAKIFLLKILLNFLEYYYHGGIL